MMKVPGFSAAAIASGIKESSALDMGLIYSKNPAKAAAVFTTNIVKAAPVIIGTERMKNHLCQAVVVNSGNANACTGQGGFDDAFSTTKLVAGELGIDENLVIPSSTGVIGVPLPMDKIKEGIPKLVSSLSEDGLDDFAHAIMTTDKFPKYAYKQMDINGAEGTVCVIGKGAGMIAPNMATMLAFILTDIDVEQTALVSSLQATVDESYNKIIVDGDISTNDTTLILSNGELGNIALKETDSAYKLFLETLIELNTQIARMIVKDGEGATKVVTIKVIGARSVKDARSIARAMGTSLLVKTALFGEDANWGRFIAAAGAAGAPFDSEKIDLYFETFKVLENGLNILPEDKYAHVFKKPEFEVVLDVKSGSFESFVVVSDITIDYIKLNSDYRT